MSYRSMTLLVCASKLCLALGVFVGISDFVPPIALEDVDAYDAEDESMESTRATTNPFDVMRNFIAEKNKRRYLYNGEKLPARMTSFSESVFDTETLQSQDGLQKKRNDRRVKACYRKFHNNNMRRKCLMQAI